MGKLAIAIITIVVHSILLCHCHKSENGKQEEQQEQPVYYDFDTVVLGADLSYVNMIVETAYPWTSGNADNYTNIISGNNGTPGYGVSEEEQLRYMQELTQAVISDGGSGVIYWEPAWISSSFRDQWGEGSSWENNAFFNFSGEVLPGINFMNFDYKF